MTRREFAAYVAGSAARAQQFESTSAVVLVPATVTDASGRMVRGLREHDFTVSDDGEPQRVRSEEDPLPVSVVLGLHASYDARKPLDRMRKAASLFGPIVAGATGEAAVLAIREEVEVASDFTNDFEAIETTVRTMLAERSGCSLVDGVAKATEMLASRPAGRRRVVVLMTEDRDRSSKSDLKSVVLDLERAHVTVYALTYSPALMMFGREVPSGP